MTVFLHTADLQIGKPYKNIKNDQKRFKIQQERINALDRIKEISIENSVEWIAISGDLFDCCTLQKEIIMETLDKLNQINLPILVIPGNHDDGGSGGIWKRIDMQKQIKKRAPKIEVLMDKKPYVIGKNVILPCPLLRRHETVDPTEWIKSINWSEIPKELTRIVMAHGSVREFDSPDYDLSEFTKKEKINTIDIENLPYSEIDYIALGDWHNMKKINEKTYYAGTPEQDRFDQKKNEKRSQVLVIDAKRGHNPKIKEINSGKLNWHNIEISLNSRNDIEYFKDCISNCIKDRVNTDLVKLTIDGNLGLSEYKEYQEIIEELNSQLLHIEIRGICNRLPKESELKSLTESREDPIIMSVANRIKEEIENINRNENIDENEKQILELALCELHRITFEATNKDN